MAEQKRKGSKRLFISNWRAIIGGKKAMNVSLMRPGNFYKIELYKYNDGKTVALSGPKTTHIFLIGKYKEGKDYYLAALKLKHVNPEHFFTDIKQLFKFKPMTEEKITQVYDEYEQKLDQFRRLLQMFPMDGRRIFNIIKRKKRIYTDNYREYKLTSVKKCEYLKISEEYLNSKLTIVAEKTDEKKDRRDETNTRVADTKKQATKGGEQIKPEPVSEPPKAGGKLESKLSGD